MEVDSGRCKLLQVMNARVNMPIPLSLSFSLLSLFVSLSLCLFVSLSLSLSFSFSLFLSAALSSPLIASLLSIRFVYLLMTSMDKMHRRVALPPDFFSDQLRRHLDPELK